MIVCGEGDRIYFAEDAHQALALVVATIGLKNPPQWVDYLTQRVEAGPVDELRFRGEAVECIVGQLVYVSTRQERPAPLFAIDQPVSFYTGHMLNTVSGIALYKDRRDHCKTVWHYFYAGGHAGHHPMSEAHTRAAQQPAPVPTSAEAAVPAAPPAAAPAEPAQFSEAMQLLIGSQAATVQDVARQTQASPRKAAKLLKEMKERYGPTPTLINLALFSGAADLMTMITALRKPATPAAAVPQS